MVGGLTPVLELATLADAFDAIVSPHFLPGLFAHTAAAAPSIRWLEEFPLLEPLFDGWPELTAAGTMTAADRPGHGLTLADRYRSENRLGFLTTTLPPCEERPRGELPPLEGTSHLPVLR